jgi:hypothetical protein
MVQELTGLVEPWHLQAAGADSPVCHPLPDAISVTGQWISWSDKSTAEISHRFDSRVALQCLDRLVDIADHARVLDAHKGPRLNGVERSRPGTLLIIHDSGMDFKLVLSRDFDLNRVDFQFNRSDVANTINDNTPTFLEFSRLKTIT